MVFLLMNLICLSVPQVELHAARLPKSWGNRTAAFSHFFGEMAKQQYRVANHEINFRKVDWYTQFKTVRCSYAPPSQDASVSSMSRSPAPLQTLPLMPAMQSTPSADSSPCHRPNCSYCSHGRRTFPALSFAYSVRRMCRSPAWRSTRL